VSKGVDRKYKSGNKTVTTGSPDGSKGIIRRKQRGNQKVQEG